MNILALVLWLNITFGEMSKLYYNINVKKLSLTIVLITLTLGSFAATRVSAMPETEVIMANCRAAQSILSQIEKADAVLRINRGRSYNNMLNLLFAMNARLSSNRINAPRLAEITSNFENRLNTFRDNYGRYDDILADAININCVANPDEFYNKLDTTRANRAELAGDVTALNQLINDYRTEFNNVVEGL